MSLNASVWVMSLVPSISSRNWGLYIGQDTSVSRKRPGFTRSLGTPSLITSEGTTRPFSFWLRRAG